MVTLTAIFFAKRMGYGAQWNGKGSYAVCIDGDFRIGLENWDFLTLWPEKGQCPCRKPSIYV
jgi:hypothetical protein